ncbi:unnamed protein product [Clavelina lepadiformis]|uniref:Golgi apparatus protein 1 n=1 Tax=Clavelina lepadiformis TaxID=159417 RepID=A0ABP0GBH8_CLALP
MAFLNTKLTVLIFLMCKLCFCHLKMVTMQPEMDQQKKIHASITNHIKLNQNDPSIHVDRGNVPLVVGDEVTPGERRSSQKYNIQQQPKTYVKKTKLKAGLIADSEECAEDVLRLCRGRHLKTNLDVLNCLVNEREDQEDLSEDCHQLIWNYKLNVTTSVKFAAIAKEVCKKDLANMEACAKYVVTDGKLISCLIDNLDAINSDTCNTFLRKIETVMFSDYRLICDFISDCREDVNTLKCGNADDGGIDPDAPHSQGKVVDCLEKQYARGHTISDKCEKQIRRLAELSADDFHLDRHLYFECREDREKICGHVEAGEGRVYKCLFDHKFDRLMSQGCRDALKIRQEFIMEKDYKASYGIQEACAEDIRRGKCMQYAKSMNNDNDEAIGLSSIMLCLENQKLSGAPITEQCDDQLVDFRQMLFEDFGISPELAHKCQHEIQNYCGTRLEKDGGTMHCLLRAAQKENSLSPSCQEEVMNLIKESEVGQDYRMDPVLTRACNEVIQLRCNNYEGGDPMVLSCLMDHLYSSDMTTNCKQKLLELQYFISRDFMVDPIFNENCREDAKRLCFVDLGGGAGGLENNEPEKMPFSLVMSCFHNHMPVISNGSYNDGNKEKLISVECEEEVRRILRQRALDYNLNPTLEENCRSDLGQLCSEELRIESGKEFICLQDHYEELRPQCKVVVQQLTQMEGDDAGDLENILISECQPMLDEFCKHLLDEADEGRVMQCLIDNKEYMSSKPCVAGVTHFQLIEMKDYKFSLKFLKACQQDVTSYCRDSVKTKADVVKCLSENIRNAVLRKTESPISSACMEEVNVDSLTMHKNIELNPELKTSCQHDIDKYCHNVKSGSAKVIECLRENQVDLSSPCHLHLYNFEKEESINPKLDFSLMRTCKADIKQHCMDSLQLGDPQSVVECLLNLKSKLTQKCRFVVNEREKEMFSDISLNPDLMDNCDNDIKLLCNAESDSVDKMHKKGEDPHGIIYACLKKHFRTQELSDSCYNHLLFVMKEQEKDYALDPQLTLNCIRSITSLCHPDNGNVVECLKKQFYDNALSNDEKCMVEVARLLAEGKSDIMADPVLHQACVEDLAKFCYNIPEGHGRLVTCLLRVSNDGKSHISRDCEEEIKSRKAMWEVASKDIKGFGDVAQHIIESEHSSYILSIFFLIILFLLVIGIMCGRFTKRVSQERKTR